jgi:hypothetical protein
MSLALPVSPTCRTLQTPGRQLIRLPFLLPGLLRPQLHLLQVCPRVQRHQVAVLPARRQLLQKDPRMALPLQRPLHRLRLRLPLLFLRPQPHRQRLQHRLSLRQHLRLW